MHPRIAELIEQRRTTGWPTKRAIHASDQAHDTADFMMQQVPRWVAGGYSAVKLIASTDSQVNTIIAANKINYHPIWIVRFYGNNAPDDFIDPVTVKKYVDQGCYLFESTANEFYAGYENKWGHLGQAMPRDWPQQIAHQFGKQAEAILNAGGVPLTPSIETWHAEYFFMLFEELTENYGDILRQSVLTAHNRTLNHPPSYTKDPGGYLGWEDFDDYVFKHLGEHMAYIATESGPEPGWDMDREVRDSNLPESDPGHWVYPPVTVDMHTAWVKEILAWPTPDYYLFDCLWEWKGRGGFARASYIENQEMMQGRDLPVVAMLETWRPEVSQPPVEPPIEPPVEPPTPPEPPVVIGPTEEEIRNEGWNKPIEIVPIAYNSDWAYPKYARLHNLGVPLTNTWDWRGLRLQKFSGALVYAPLNQWDKTTHIAW